MTNSSLEGYLAEGARIMLFVFLGVAVALFLLHGLLSVLFRYPLDYGEAPLVDQALRLAAGGNIYSAHLGEPPYTVTNYPPLYVLVQSPLLALTGPTFAVGRAISVLSALAVAFFLGLLIRVWSGDGRAALATGMLFLAVPYVVYWSGLARIDLLAMALSTAGLYAIVRWPEGRQGVVIGGLLLVAAIFTRQSYALAAPLGAFAWLWTRERRRAVELAVVVGGLSLILFVVLQALTGGFYAHVITANVNAFSWERVSEGLGGLGWVMPLLVLLAVLFVALGWRWGDLWPLLAFYGLGALISAATYGKIGSNVNYFIELSAALSLIAGAALVWSAGRRWWRVVLPLLLVLQIGVLMGTTVEEYVPRLTDHRLDEPALRLLEGIVADVEGPVLADEYMGMLTLDGQPLALQPFEMSQLARAGEWDQRPLVEGIEAGRFPLILIHHFSPGDTTFQERWTAEMLAAVEARYRPWRTLGGTVVHVPQEAAAGEQGGEGAGGPMETAEAVPTNETAVAVTANLGTGGGAGGAGAFQAAVAASPVEPDHVALVVTVAEERDCLDPGCPLALRLFISLDGGASWEAQPSFAGPSQSAYAGDVAFGPDGMLYVSGVRDGTLMFNAAAPEDGYWMEGVNQVEVTRAQVLARPELHVDGESGRIYLAYLAQFENRLFTAPAMQWSDDGGRHWSVTGRVDQMVAMGDIERGRASPAEDIQLLPGEGERVALVWVWGAAPQDWPRGVWLAVSENGGREFGPPLRIATTWGSIGAAASEDGYAVLYRPEVGSLALALSEDGGESWLSRQVDSGVELGFDPSKAPAVDLAQDGVIDVLFYAPAGQAEGCVRDIEGWRQGSGWPIDECPHDVFYSFSRDRGESFSRPVRLNEAPLEGMLLGGLPAFGADAGMASADGVAFGVWMGEGVVRAGRIER